jgi:hypothetical protein
MRLFPALLPPTIQTDFEGGSMGKIEGVSPLEERPRPG